MKRIENAVLNFIRATDVAFWIITLMATTYGLILIYSLSRAGGNFIITQSIAVCIGYIGAIIISTRNYEYMGKIWILIGIAAIALLIVTLLIGWGPDGVDDKSWISIGPINFQPSELVKILFLVTFSKHLSILQERNLLETFKGVVTLCIHMGIVVLLIHIQGDDGTALVFVFMFLFMTFGCKVQMRYFVIMVSALSVSLPVVWNFILNDDQRARFLAVMDLDSNVLGTGWQQYQGKVSIASGQLLGRGLFKGPRVSRELVPYQESDFVFTVAGEELGFIGCVLILVLLFAMCIRALMIALKAKDIMGRGICFGFLGMILSQSAINISMCLGLIPVVGITLPFFSSGGSSVMCLYFGVGLVQSVYSCRDDENIVKIKVRNRKGIYS